MSLRSVVLVASIAATPLVTAQTFTWPSGFDNRLGGSSMETPFSIAPNPQPLTTRNTVLINDWTIRALRGRTLTGVAFRRDGVHNESYGGFTATVEVRLGIVRDALAPNALLREPYRDPPTRVAWGTLNIPGAGFPSGVPAFSLDIPFRTPYPYGANGGDLGLDVWVESDRARTWRRDAVSLDAETPGSTAPIVGAARGSNGRFPLAWVDTETLYPGGVLSPRLEGAALPGGPGLALWLMGRLTTPTPLAPIGFPTDAFLGLRPELAVPADLADRSSSFARASGFVQLPNDATLTGTTFAIQWLAYDAGLATQLPFTTSNALLVSIGRGRASGAGVGRVFWGRGVRNVEGDFQGEIGPIGWVPIVQFR